MGLTPSSRKAIPTSWETMSAAPLRLFYVEAVNPTAGDITLSVQDADGLPAIVDTILAGKLLTYESKFGTPMNGLRWMASAPGLVGWYCGG